MILEVMIIPKKIKIGKFTFNVKEKLLLIKGENISGKINYGNLNLIIKSGMVDRAKEDTFFHEIAHGILKELEFNHPKISNFRNNEPFVQELGLLLRKTFIDLMNKQK